MGDISKSRVQAEDRAAIEDLLARWAYCFDTGDLTGWLDCHAKDAEVVISVQGMVVAGPMTGAEDLRQFFDQTKASRGKVGQHTVSNLFVVRSDEEAADTITNVMFSEIDGQAVRVVTTGHYEDHLARDADGQWRIAKRLIRLDLGF